MNCRQRFEIGYRFWNCLFQWLGIHCGKALVGQNLDTGPKLWEWYSFTFRSDDRVGHRHCSKFGLWRFEVVIPVFSSEWCYYYFFVYHWPRAVCKITPLQRVCKLIIRVWNERNCSEFRRQYFPTFWRSWRIKNGNKISENIREVWSGTTIRSLIDSLPLTEKVIWMIQALWGHWQFQSSWNSFQRDSQFGDDPSSFKCDPVMTSSYVSPDRLYVLESKVSVRNSDVYIIILRPPMSFLRMSVIRS
jgi:hypothetical protein